MVYYVGVRRENQEIEDGANAKNVWVWMKPHIGFCTIGNCGHHFHLPLRRSLLLGLHFQPLFHGAFHALVSADEVFTSFFRSLLLFFLFLCSFFFRILLAWGETLLVWNLLEESQFCG